MWLRNVFVPFGKCFALFQNDSPPTTTTKLLLGPLSFARGQQSRRARHYFRRTVYCSLVCWFTNHYQWSLTFSLSKYSKSELFICFFSILFLRAWRSQRISGFKADLYLTLKFETFLFANLNFWSLMLDALCWKQTWMEFRS